MTDTPAVLNVATRRFVVGQDRLRESLGAVGFKGTMMAWHDRFPPGSPTQHGHRWPHGPGEVPYRFKTYALKAALEA